MFVLLVYGYVYGVDEWVGIMVDVGVVVWVRTAVLVGLVALELVLLSPENKREYIVGVR